MLTAAGLTLWRGANCLFEDLELAVAAGAALLVEGPNGAGKTTLLRVLAGLTLPDAGEVRWQGEPAGAGPGAALFAYAGHAAALKPDLDVRENLQFYARLAGFPAGDIPGVLAATGLEACADVDTRFLSAGQKRRAALARVLMSRAPIWLLDEPHTNLDADGREFLAGTLRAHLAGGGLAVIALHQAIDLGPAPVGRLRLGGTS